MKNSTVSLRSPKNKFRIEFKYAKPIKGIGSVCSITTNDVSESQNAVGHYIQMAQRNCVGVLVTVTENMKTYPEFQWVKVNQYKA